MSVIYSKAAEWGYLADDAPNPTRRVKPNREHSRDRWVNPPELPRLRRDPLEEHAARIAAAAAS